MLVSVVRNVVQAWESKKEGCNAWRKDDGVPMCSSFARWRRDRETCTCAIRHKGRKRLLYTSRAHNHCEIKRVKRVL